MTRFELFVASRYLRAHRKERVISVITLISIIGVAAGVMALVVGLAVTNGFRTTLQGNLLRAMGERWCTPRELAEETDSRVPTPGRIEGIRTTLNRFVKQGLVDKSVSSPVRYRRWCLEVDGNVVRLPGFPDTRQDST